MKNAYHELDLIIQSCACANLRKAARTVTQYYEKQMVSTGLKVTQYYMLANIARNGKTSISHLGDMMLLEQSTVTRNVNLLMKSGYVNITRDTKDSRTKSVSLTDLGQDKLKEATPIWAKAQNKIENEVVKDQFKDFLKTLQQLQQSIESFDE